VIWYWIAGLGAAALLGILSRRGERPADGSAARRSDGVLPSPAEIDGLLRAGQKIEAIKMYRLLHGVDLKAAKDAVDARARELGR
jgi:ribosomal protein L7/L12